MMREGTADFYKNPSESCAFALSIRVSALFLNLCFKIPKSANLNHYFNFAFSPEHGRHATLQALSLSQTPVSQAYPISCLALSLQYRHQFFKPSIHQPFHNFFFFFFLPHLSCFNFQWESLSGIASQRLIFTSFLQALKASIHKPLHFLTISLL